MSRTQPEAMLSYFRNEERAAYTNILANLAGQRKLRPVFIQRKPVADQIAWMIRTLQLPSCDDLAQQLLELWLMSTQAEMMGAFLTALGVEHDGDGRVDDIPRTLDGDKVKAGVDTLLERFPVEEVALYMHIFNSQQTGGWPEIEEALDDPRLAWSGEG